MCGLVGVAGNITAPHKKMFRDMLVMDGVRGFDSTGVLSVDSSNAAKVEKEVGGASELWTYHNSNLLAHDGIPKGWPKLLLGHNRWATMGKVVSDNAHPFTFDHITGAHNGSLTDWMDLEGYKEFDCDSKAVFKTIAEKGIKHCWSHFTGAAALTWWNEEEGTVNLIRNLQRPLYISYTEDKKTLFWASEPWMIVSAAYRAKEKLHVFDPEAKNDFDAHCIQLKEHMLHTFKVTMTNVTLIAPKKLEPMTEVWSNYGYYNQQYGGTVLGFKGNKVSSTNTTTVPNKSWAKNTKRGDKIVRLKEGEFLGTTHRYEHGVGTTCSATVQVYVDGEEYPYPITIYPETWVEWSSLRNAAEAVGGKRKVKLLTRPRVKFDTEGNLKEVCIAFSNVEILTADGSNSSDSRQTPAPKEVTKQASSGAAVPLIYKGPHGKYVSELRWKELVKNSTGRGGCFYCGDPFDLNDHESITWLSEEEPVCVDCITEAGSEGLFGQLRQVH